MLLLSPHSCGLPLPPPSCGLPLPPPSCGLSLPLLPSCGLPLPPLSCGLPLPPPSCGLSLPLLPSCGLPLPLLLSCGLPLPPPSCALPLPLLPSCRLPLLLLPSCRLPLLPRGQFSLPRQCLHHMCRSHLCAVLHRKICSRLFYPVWTGIPGPLPLLRLADLSAGFRKQYNICLPVQHLHRSWDNISFYSSAFPLFPASAAMNISQKQSSALLLKCV